MVHGALHHFILDQIRTVVLWETIGKHVGKYFQASKAAAAVKGLIRNDEYLAPIASFVQMKTMDEIAEQYRLQVFIARLNASRASQKAALAAEDSLAQEDRPARVLKALVRRDIKVVCHTELSIILAVATLKTKAKSRASQSQQC